jgi:hypothetical protein
MFTVPVCEPVTPSTGEMVSGVKPLGPEMVQVAGGLVTFQVNGIEVAVVCTENFGLSLKFDALDNLSPRHLRSYIIDTKYSPE